MLLVSGGGRGVDEVAMPDIFLSYSSQDRSLATAVAKLLAERGLSIWYDETLGTGSAYRATIKAAIEGAHVVLVLWTSAACDSNWVKDEAAIGARRGVLFSIDCGAVSVPADFRRSVFGRIKRPDRGPTTAEISELTAGVTNILTIAQSNDRVSAKRLRSRLVDFVSTSIIVGVLVGSVIWSMPTHQNAPNVFGDSVLKAVASVVVGSAVGAIGFASSRLADHFAMKYLRINVGPSLARLLYRWGGEATGCTLLLMLTLVVKKDHFLANPATFAEHFIEGLVLSWGVLVLAFSVKYTVFVFCRQCRYFLLM